MYISDNSLHQRGLVYAYEYIKFHLHKRPIRVQIKLTIAIYEERSVKS